MPRMGSMKDAKGGDKDEVRERWKEYTEKLYDVDSAIHPHR